MLPREKILAYMKEHRMKANEFAELVGISRSNLGKYLKAGGPNVSILHGLRITDAMQWSLDWFYKGENYPPPKKTDKSIVLAPAQKAILELASEISGGDPSYAEARRRLLAIGTPMVAPGKFSEPIDEPAQPANGRRRSGGKAV